MKWISVNEVLPEPSTPERRNLVLMWFLSAEGWRVQIGEISYPGHWRPESGNGNFDDYVTHWMPLPTRPDKEG